MDWDAVSAIGEILGALGVLASLVYLARQIGQNTRAMERTDRSYRASQESMLNSRFVDIRRDLCANPELNRLFIVGLVAPDKLTYEEWFRFSAFIYTMFMANGEAFQMNDEVMVERSAALEEILSQLFRYPGARRAWQEMTTIDEQFGAVGDAILGRVEPSTLAELRSDPPPGWLPGGPDFEIPRR